MSALKVTDVSQEKQDDARLFYLKLQGRRAKNVPDATEAKEEVTQEAQRRNSVSQQGYDNRIDHLEKLIVVLESEPSYSPNEQELSFDGLRQRLSQMRKANSIVKTRLSELNREYLQRNSIISNTKDGLVDRAKKVKAYILSLHGRQSPQYKKIAKLYFRAV